MVASERSGSEPAVARERRTCRASGTAAMRGKGDDGSATWAGQVGGASGDAAVASVVNRDGGNGAKASVVSEANGMYVEVRRNNRTIEHGIVVREVIRAV